MVVTGATESFSTMMAADGVERLPTASMATSIGHVITERGVFTGGSGRRGNDELIANLDSRERSRNRIGKIEFIDHVTGGIRETGVGLSRGSRRFDEIRGFTFGVGREFPETRSFCRALE